MTPNSPSELHYAFPDQEVDLYGRAELMSVFEQNRAEELRLNPEQEPVSSVLGQIAVDIHKDFDPSAEISPNFQDSVQRSHFAMLEMLTPLGIALPELSDFARAGVDFAKLDNYYGAMEQDGIQPEIVLVPTLSVEQWQQIYLNLQNNPRTNSDRRIKHGGLHIDTNIQGSWDFLMKQNINNRGHTLKAADGVIWQAMLIPGIEDPIPTTDDYSLGNPTIPAYLSLQAMRLHTLAGPLDAYAYTWLDGMFTAADNWHAPRGDWCLESGQVSVDKQLIERDLMFMGLRLPVLG